MPTHETVIQYFNRLKCTFQRTAPTRHKCEHMAGQRWVSEDQQESEQIQIQTGSWAICTSTGHSNCWRKHSSSYSTIICPLLSRNVSQVARSCGWPKPPVSVQRVVQETEAGLSSLIERPCVPYSLPNTGSGRQEEDGRVFITLQHVTRHVGNWNVVFRN